MVNIKAAVSTAKIIAIILAVVAVFQAVLFYDVQLFLAVWYTAILAFMVKLIYDLQVIKQDANKTTSIE